MSVFMKVDSKTVVDLLRTKHAGQIFVEELRGGSGYGGTSESRMDAWAMHPYPSKQNCRTAYEIKISRSDFLRDIKQPLKHRAAVAFSNEFYFVAPKGMIKPEELPFFAGLLEVVEYKADKPWLGLVPLIDAPWRDTNPPSWRFVASLARSIAKASS